jgi:hypothetical protein
MRYLYVKYQNPIPYGSKDIAQVKVFFKTSSKFKIKVTRSILLVPKERSLHEVSICEISVFENLVKVQVQSHKVKSLGTKRKISS